MEAQQSNMVLIMDTDYAEFRIERNEEDLLFFHCEVKKWSKGIYKQLIEDMLDMLEQLNNIGVYNLLAVVGNAKLEKFATMFGWEYLSDLDMGRKLYGVRIK